MSLEFFIYIARVMVKVFIYQGVSYSEFSRQWTLDLVSNQKEMLPRGPVYRDCITKLWLHQRNYQLFVYPKFIIVNCWNGVKKIKIIWPSWLCTHTFHYHDYINTHFDDLRYNAHNSKSKLVLQKLITR